MKREIRVGIIGVGIMGQHHARIFAAMPGITLVGVADSNRDCAHKVASQYGVSAYTDYRALLDQVEAVSLAAPTTLHHEIGLACLERGVHTLIEKPLAASLDEARELAWHAMDSELVFQVGHVERFNPTFVELVHVLANHKILALEGRRLSPFATRAADVSVVYDLMVHDLDLILTLVDVPLVSVQAVGGQVRSSQPDHAMTLLTFTNGQVASLSASKVTQHKVRQMAITCTEAFVVADFLARTVMIYRQSVSDYSVQRNEVLYRQEGLIEQVYVPQREPLYAEIHHFLSCIREGRRPLVDANAAIRVMTVADIVEERILTSLGNNAATLSATYQNMAKDPIYKSMSDAIHTRSLTS